MNEQPIPISIDQIRASAERLKGKSFITPLLESPFLNQLAGKRVLVKAECLQRTGSFKFRGAWSAVSALSTDILQRGVIAYSSGNHAQGVALAAKLAGSQAVIIMPGDAPQLKIANTRQLGAEVVLYDRPGGENREKLGEELANERGLHLIRPYDDPYVVCGQGTCGLEIAEQAQSLGIKQATVLVCCGGGGLTSGIATALESDAPDFIVRPVEPQYYDDVVRSQIAGSRQFVTGSQPSICDAIVTPAPGELTFPVIKEKCKTGLVVSDREALMAMGQALMRLKVIAEPGGAVALAAALYHSIEIDSDVVIATISGGNADPQTIAQALEMTTVSSE